jgi:hypothetical protein
MTAVPTDRSLLTLTAEDFRPLLGTRFRLTAWAPADAPGASVDTDLAEVTEHPGGAGAPLRTSFSVLFHGPLHPLLPQGMYRVEHDELGTLELFLVPVGPDEPAVPGAAPAAMRYEAVFG